MTKHLSDDALDYFRQQGKKRGSIGGKIAAANMTKAQHRARRSGLDQADREVS